MTKMTLEEMKKLKRDIEKDCEKKINKLYIEYATDNSPYKIGDIIGDGDNIIKINSVSTYIDCYKTPLCVYTGPRLKKNLEPFKNEENAVIYQNKVEKVYIGES